MRGCFTFHGPWRGAVPEARQQHEVARREQQGERGDRLPGAVRGIEAGLDGEEEADFPDGRQPGLPQQPGESEVVPRVELEVQRAREGDSDEVPHEHHGRHILRVQRPELARAAPPQLREQELRKPALLGCPLPVREGEEKAEVQQVHGVVGGRLPRG